MAASVSSLAGPSPTSPVSKHGSKAFVDDPPAAASASSLAFSSASAFASASAFTGLSAFVGPFSVPLLQDFWPLWVPFQLCQQLLRPFDEKFLPFRPPDSRSGLDSFDRSRGFSSASWGSSTLSTTSPTFSTTLSGIASTGLGSTTSSLTFSTT